MGIKKYFDSGYRELKKDKKIAEKVMALDSEYQKLTDDELKAKTDEFRARYKNGETLDQLLPEAFATVREAAYRVINKKPFFVQVVGGIAIHGGNISEMRTGEGKTLTATMPAYLNAITGDGVHIVTVNEYLADREANGEIGELFRWLGLSVGLNIRDYDKAQKREAYNCDILYSTNAELGFDYLRDNMVQSKEDMVNLRGLNCAIIDEVDSILIDEARTPLIISGGEKGSEQLFVQADRFVKSIADEDFEIDIEAKTVALTPSGIAKAERRFGIANIYDLEYVDLVHHIDNALKANMVMVRDKDYMVSEEGEVLIIDSFTGRVLKGRQYSEGLHQAIEAKEGVEIKKETVTIATITYQNFFRMYKKLSGMTGTAKTEEEEFRNIYNMYVVEVPTNKPVIRQDYPDYLFVTNKAKYDYLLNDVKEMHAKGQPILIGTVAVETSEYISKLLKNIGIKHEVLNAKNHAREAEIVAHAGEIGAVTIATNMAGRGTDIKLAPGVAELGGLAIVGTERHESRRIDNQLRGRSGRQGDPGQSRFYISAEDELLMRFGGDTFKSRIEMMINLQEADTTKPLESKMMTKFVTSAQKRIEGNNFDSRKNVLKYDEVLAKQREIFYKERYNVIDQEDISEYVNKLCYQCVENVCYLHMDEVGHNKYKIDDEAIFAAFNNNLLPAGLIELEKLQQCDEKEIIEYIYSKILENFDKKPTEILTVDVWHNFEKYTTLRIIDKYWTEHIDTMSALRQSASLQSYAQTNPLVVYQQQARQRYDKMMENISNDVVKYLTHAEARVQTQEQKPREMHTNQADDVSLKKKPAQVEASARIGRNDLCPCGSGKKYKYCCGK